MIKIKVKCFSQVKYALGVDEFVIELNAGTSASELEQKNSVGGRWKVGWYFFTNCGESKIYA